MASIADSNLSAFIHALCEADPHWWPGILHFFTTIVAEPPAAAALAEPADAALAEPAAASLADPAPTPPVADPADAVVANPHAASLAEALSDTKVPSLAAVIVGVAPGAVAHLLGAVAAHPLADAVVADHLGGDAAEPAAAVVAAPSAISLAKPLNASAAAATLTAVPLIDWISDTLSQGYTNLQSLVKCLDHRGIASDTVCSQARLC